MRNKFISIFLSFVLFFSSCFVSFADDTVLSDSNIDVSVIEPYFIESIVLAPELIAMIGTVAVGAGIYLQNKDDLYDVARLFYERNASNWDNVLEAFGKCAIVSPSNMVKVGSQFLEYCKSAFDEYFLTGFDSSTTISSSGLYAGMPYYEVPSGTLDAYSTLANKAKGVVFPYKNLGSNFSIGDYLFKYSSTSGGYHYYNVYLDSSLVSSSVKFGTDSSMAKGDEYVLWLCLIGSKICMYFYATDLPYRGSLFNHSIVGSAISVPTGSYDWDRVDEKVDEEGGVVVGLPGVGDSLIGEGVDVFNPTYGLTTDGTVSLPNVSNPSVSVGDSVALPVEGVVGEGSATDEGVWGKVKDFVISLVVPSDLFWTSAFEGVYAEFNNSFPMINLDNFKMLAVGGKPFPNIYINFLGSKCKIVDGDVINSIVDWLRPLIAGFMMLCLMLFNYRKIYKLIRNTEPFGSIATGTSEFRTGMSAPGMSEGFSSYDIARDQLRDVAFEMRNEILSRKHGGK